MVSTITTVQTNVTLLDKAIDAALKQTGGSVIDIPVETLSALRVQIAQLQELLIPLIYGSDAIASSRAADLSGTLRVLDTAFSNSLNRIITTLKLVNPNIYQLAARFYGSPALYELITEENGLTDPLPESNEPMELRIPLRPNSSESTIATVMQDALPR